VLCIDRYVGSSHILRSRCVPIFHNNQVKFTE
jgi:hypothetical protein